MRILILSVALCAFSAAADDDGYYQRQMESQLQAQRVDAQRLENQRIESQRIAQQQQQRSQDRLDQQRTDERFDQQQADRRDLYERNAAQQRRNSDSLMQSTIQLGLSQSRRGTARPRTECAPIELPREQAVEEDLNGYFAPEGTKPYFLSALKLGPQGKRGRLSVTAYVRDGELPTVVKQLHLELMLHLRDPSGAVRSFKGVAGSVEFSAAVQNPAKGRFAVELTDLVLVEMDGYAERRGGACLSAATFHFSANWNQAPSIR